jgi:hypothetical protein
MAAAGRRSLPGSEEVLPRAAGPDDANDKRSAPTAAEVLRRFFPSGRDFRQPGEVVAEPRCRGFGDWIPSRDTPGRFLYRTFLCRVTLSTPDGGNIRRPFYGLTVVGRPNLGKPDASHGFELELVWP